jgi:hypothetical protein
MRTCGAVLPPDWVQALRLIELNTMSEMSEKTIATAREEICLIVTFLERKNPHV